MAVSRRNFIKVSAAAAAVGVLSSFGVGLHEPHETVLHKIPVTLDRLPSAFDGFRIAQLSDIHFNSFMTPDHFQKLVRLVNEQKPDAVVLTGDFVTAHGTARDSLAAATECAHLMRDLKSTHGNFAVLGNHDCQVSADGISEALSSVGIGVLRNQTHSIEQDGAILNLVGVDNVTSGLARPEKALSGVDPSACCIAAVHEPDIADELRNLPVDFQISGHSHGGQIRFPGFGAVILPPWARKYPKGAYRVGKLQLYTNSGVGEIGLPMRLLCPPEVSVFELRIPGANRG